MQHSTSQQPASLDWSSLPTSSAALRSAPEASIPTTELFAAAQPSSVQSGTLPTSPGFQPTVSWSGQDSGAASSRLPAARLKRASPPGVTGDHKRLAQSAQAPSPQRPCRTLSSGPDFTQDRPASRVTPKSAEEPRPAPAWVHSPAGVHQGAQAGNFSRGLEPQGSLCPTFDSAAGDFPSIDTASSQPPGFVPASRAQDVLQTRRNSSSSASTASAGPNIIPLLSPFRALAAQSQNLPSPFQAPSATQKAASASSAMRRKVSGKCNVPPATQAKQASKPGAAMTDAQALALDLLNSIQQLAGWQQHERILLPGHLQPADTHSAASASSFPAQSTQTTAPRQLQTPQSVQPGPPAMASMPPPPSRPPSGPAFRPPSPSALGLATGSRPQSSLPSSFPPRRRSASQSSPDSDMGPPPPSCHTSTSSSPSTFGAVIGSRPQGNFPQRHHSGHQHSPASNISSPRPAMQATAVQLHPDTRSVSVPDASQLPGYFATLQGSPGTQPCPRHGHVGPHMLSQLGNFIQVAGPPGQIVQSGPVHLERPERSFSVPNAFQRPGQLQGIPNQMQLQPLAEGSGRDAAARGPSGPQSFMAPQPLPANSHGSGGTWPAGSESQRPDLAGYPSQTSSKVEGAGMGHAPSAHGFSPEDPTFVGARPAHGHPQSQSLVDALTPNPATQQHHPMCRCSQCNAARAAMPWQGPAFGGPAWGSCHHCGCRHPRQPGGLSEPFSGAHPHSAQSMPHEHAMPSNPCSQTPQPQAYQPAAAPMPDTGQQVMQVQQTPAPCNSVHCIRRPQQHPPAPPRRLTSEELRNLAELQCSSQAPPLHMYAGPPMGTINAQIVPQLLQQIGQHSMIPVGVSGVQTQGVVSTANLPHWALGFKGQMHGSIPPQLAFPPGAGVADQPHTLQTHTAPQGMGGSSLSAGHPPRPDAQEVPLGSPMPPQPIREPGPALPHGEVLRPGSSSGRLHGPIAPAVPHQGTSIGQSMGQQPTMPPQPEEPNEAATFDCRNAAAKALFRIRDAYLEQQRHPQGPGSQPGCSPRQALLGDSSWVDDVFIDTPRASGVSASRALEPGPSGQRMLPGDLKPQDSLPMPSPSDTRDMNAANMGPGQHSPSAAHPLYPAIPVGAGHEMPPSSGQHQQAGSINACPQQLQASDAHHPPQPSGGLGDADFGPLLENLLSPSHSTAETDVLDTPDLSLEPGPEDVNPNCIALSSQDACCRLPRTTNTPSKRVCPRHPQVSFSESLASSIVLWQQSSRVCDLSEHLSRMTFLPHLPSCIPRPI
ncbi:hypothetical protein WJX74_006525 [Apatococcus lobatus]|uniref:Uncharacterized protein n=1 Tax=Apatococcus lobatus TaxID=904363 RepID=A0AAW1R2U7_9CHLO